MFLETRPQQCLNPPLPHGFNHPPENGWYYDDQWYRECERCYKEHPLLTNYSQHCNGSFPLVCDDCRTKPTKTTRQCLRIDCNRAYQELALSEFAVVKGVIYSYCKQCQASMRKGYKLKKQNKQPTQFDCRSCKQSKQLLDYNLVTRLGKQERDLTCVECRQKQKRLLGVLIK